jgi:hypothetical protein
MAGTIELRVTLHGTPEEVRPNTVPHLVKVFTFHRERRSLDSTLNPYFIFWTKTKN